MAFSTNTRSVFLIGALILQCFTAAFGDDDAPNCFCLKQHLSDLRMPVHMVPTELDGPDVYLLAEQSGRIYKFNPTANSDDKLTTYIDLSLSNSFPVRGLLGFALHPEFVTNRKLYVSSVRNIANADYVAISEITGTELATEEFLLLVKHSGAIDSGGQLLFGDDGYLYIMIADMGPADQNDAQNPDKLFGKILRIDINNVTVADFKLQYYVVPEDNPKEPDWRPEIYGLGIQNMWRCSKDRGDPDTGAGKGRIFCSDIGRTKDEIDVIAKGGNYGWNYREGLQCLSLNQTTCDTIEDEVLPIFSTNRTTGGVVEKLVGGYVYRGSAFPGLHGHYVYGDYVSGSVHSIQETSANNWTKSNFSPCDVNRCDCNTRGIALDHLLSFAESQLGELFMLMTDEASSGNAQGGLFELIKPNNVTVACGADQLRMTTMTSLLMLLFSAIIPTLTRMFT